MNNCWILPLFPSPQRILTSLVSWTPPWGLKFIDCSLQAVCVALSHSVVSSSVTPATVAHQAPLSMGIQQARILEGLSCPPPEDLPNPGIKLRSPALWVDSLPSEPPGKPNLPPYIHPCVNFCYGKNDSVLKMNLDLLNAIFRSLYNVVKSYLCHISLPSF